MRNAIRHLNKYGEQFYCLLRACRLVWTATRNWTIVWLILLTVLGLLPSAVVIWIKHLVDALVSGVRQGNSWAAMQPAVHYAVLVGAALLLMELLSSALEWVRTLQAETIQDYITFQVQKKSLEVDLAFYESPEYYNSMYRARDESATRPAYLLEHLGAVFQNLLTILAMTLIVARYSPWMIAAMMASVVPGFFVVARYNWLLHKWWKGSTVERRWTQYYDQKFTTATAAAEIRLFKLGPMFQESWNKLRRHLRVERLKMIRQQSLARIGAGLVGISVVGASVSWMAWRAFHHSATLGDLTLLYQAVMGGQSLMRSVTSSLGQVYSNSLFLNDFFEFIDLKPRIVDPPHPVPAPASVQNAISFENVTFRYPGTSRVALCDFNLHIPAGKIVAIVGPNGAGKSTLMKLLCRFYDPDSGRITIDGVDLRDMSVESLRDHLSVLFQMPNTYDASVKENIAIGNLSASPTLAEVEAAARSAGADEIISRLPGGYNALLGKSFQNGNDLSAGEWQRIAMARAFVRRAPIILLDEPTSFMDSWAEVDWFDKLKQLAKGRTTLLVTHRFTIAMRADIIRVVKEGQVIESGTHENLIAQNGFYAQSWRQQLAAGSTSLAPDYQPTETYAAVAH